MTLIVNVGQVWRNFLPLGIARVVGALSKTACLARVDAAFYQTARGLLLPFTVILSLYFLPSTQFGSRTLLGIGLVLLGFFVGILYDLQQALTLNIGIVLGVWSSLTTAVETVVLKRYSDQDDGLHMLQLLFMSSFLSILIYTPLMILTEFDQVSSIKSTRLSEFFISALSSGLVALLLSISTWLQVKITSPVTHTVVAATRGVLQSLLASIVFSEVMPVHRIFGTGFILIGTGLYTWGKTRDAKIMEERKYSSIPVVDEEEERESEIKVEEKFSAISTATPLLGHNLHFNSTNENHLGVLASPLPHESSRRRSTREIGLEEVLIAKQMSASPRWGGTMAGF